MKMSIVTARYVLMDQYQEPTEDVKSDYYVSLEDDTMMSMSYLKRGNVFYLKDQDSVGRRHLYMIIGKRYLNKEELIQCVKIFSRPYRINVVPILMNEAISFIDPHIVYNYKCSDFQKGAYYCTCGSKYIMDLVVNLHAIGLGVDTKHDYNSIWSEYIDYVERFFALYENRFGIHDTTDDVVQKLVVTTTNMIDENICIDHIERELHKSGKEVRNALGTDSVDIETSIDEYINSSIPLHELFPRKIADYTKEQAMALNGIIEKLGYDETAKRLTIAKTTLYTRRSKLRNMYCI